MGQEASLIISLVVGFAAGYVIARITHKDTKRAMELEEQLVKSEKTTNEALKRVDQALDHVKDLAVNMVNTYQNLEVVKASLQGDEVKKANAESVLLKIQNGQFQKVSYTYEGDEASKAESVVPAPVAATPETQPSSEVAPEAEQAPAAPEAPEAQEEVEKKETK